MGAQSAQYMWPAFAMLGSNAISALAAPEGQELQSFEGIPGLAPGEIMGDARDLIGELGSVLSQRASQPIQLRSAYAQQPPVYTGGGLPMPIGLSGVDPALADPSLLSLPGVDTSALTSRFQNLIMPAAGRPPGTGAPGPGPRVGHNNPPGSGVQPDDGTGQDDWYDPRFDARTPENPQGTSDGGTPTPENAAEARSPRRRFRFDPNAQLTSPEPGMGDDEGDDLLRGAGSMELLLRSFTM